MKKTKYFICLIFLSVSYSAHACMCASRPKIKSKNDLKRYSFIALVKVDSIYKSSITKKSKYDIFHEITFSILERYKGDSRNSIVINGGNRNLDIGWTDCDMGININEKWLLFGYYDKSGNLRTGFCTYSALYKDQMGQRDWLYHSEIDKVKKLRKLYSVPTLTLHPKNGLFKRHYPNGQIEFKEKYHHNKLDGMRMIYYANGNLMSKQKYKKGQKNGTFFWYDQNRNLVKKFNYQKDHPVNTCFYYYHNGHVNYKRVFNMKGEMVIDYHYSISGNLKQIFEHDSKAKEFVTTAYYPSGAVRYVDKTQEDYDNIIDYEFFKNGEVERIFVHFPNDSTKNRELIEWNKEGKLVRHILFYNDRSKKNLLNKKNTK